MEGGSNSAALVDRLVRAGQRAIAANNVSPVGKDGRTRLVLEWVDAQGKFANLLREIAGEIPMHTKDCAARKSPVAFCDCHLKDNPPPTGA